MVCTGYDTEFLRVLQRNAHTFVPPPPKPKKAKNSKLKREDGTPVRGTKRKAASNASVKGSVEAKSESDEEDAHVLGQHCQKASVTTARAANAKRRKLA